MKKTLNIILLLSFVATMLAPVTGVHPHKMASSIFLIKSLVHTLVYWKKMNARR